MRSIQRAVNLRTKLAGIDTEMSTHGVRQPLCDPHLMQNGAGILFRAHEFKQHSEIRAPHDGGSDLRYEIAHPCTQFAGAIGCGCSRDGSAISHRSHAVRLQISSLPCDDSVAGRVPASAQTHLLDTAPIPANVRILEGSPLGAMMCGAVSIYPVTAVERRSACIAYVEPNGKRVEQCGSLPLSQP